MRKQITRYSLQLVKESTYIYDEEDNTACTEEVSKLIKSVFNIHKAAEEFFVMLTLNVKCKCTGAFIISQGTLNTSLVHPREVFKRAFLNNAASIVLAHNHPSGDLTPSAEDITITNRLIEAGKLLGIEVLDHLIVTEDSHLSIIKARA